MLRNVCFWTVLSIFLFIPFGLGFVFPPIGLVFAILTLPLILGFWTGGGWSQVSGLLLGGLAGLILLGAALGHIVGM